MQATVREAEPGEQAGLAADARSNATS